MGNDTIRLMEVYKQYLTATGNMVTVIERHYEKNANGVSDELKQKQKHFQEHAHKFMERMNSDLHTLLQINWELKELEEKEMSN